MFSAVGGFRFIGNLGLRNGIYLMSNIGDIVQGFSASTSDTYFAGEDGSSGNIIMTKLGTGANTVWSTQLTGSGTTETPSNLVLDSSYNSIVIGRTNANVSNTDMYISKFDSSGALSWQKTIGDTDNDTTYDVALNDSEANVIVTGRVVGATSEAYVAKLASSNGSIVSQYFVGASYIVNSVATDSSNNIYLLCSETIDASRNNAVLFKCQTDFTITWQKNIGYGSPSTIDMKGVAVAVDTSGNIYVTTRRASGADEDYLLKFNSSGTLQWQTGFNYGTNNGFTGITIDPSGNIYIAATFGGGSTTVQLLKFDTSGAKLWGRGLSGYGGGAESCGVNNISWYNGRVLLNGYSYYASTKYGMLLNVLDSGSGMGTYASGYIWGNSPFSLVSSSLVSATNSASLNTASLTATAGTLTSSSYSTNVAQNIPF